MKKQRILVIVTGAVIGAAAVLLAALGNPGNMGFCIACFLRDIAGGMKFHTAGAVQYIRPEIIGLVLGSTIIALITKEFKPRGGSSPLTRFFIAILVMIGALMFLGCPLRMMLRIGGGDLNAIVGLVGFVGGIFVGTLFLKKGFTLKRSYDLGTTEGMLFPFITLLIFVLFLIWPNLFTASEEGAGPGAMHAAVLISLAAGLVVGALCQKSRFCTVAASRDAILFSDFQMLFGFLAVITVTLIGNLILGKLHFSFADQPVAHTDGIWNFLGMVLVGWGSVYLGGCPLRQLILAGEGNSDSGITVLGYVCGAAICHNFGLASSAKGPTKAGMIAVVAGLVLLLVIGLLNRNKEA